MRIITFIKDLHKANDDETVVSETLERLGEVLGTKAPGACCPEGTGSRLARLQSPGIRWNSNKMCSDPGDNRRWVTATVDSSTANHVVSLIPIYRRGRQVMSCVDTHKLLTCGTYRCKHGNMDKKTNPW